MTDTVRLPYRLPLLFAPVILLALVIACGGGNEETSTGSTPTPTQPAVAATATAAPAESIAASSNCPPPSGTAPEVTVKKYDQRPAMAIDPAKKYTATVKTVRGDFTIEFRPDLAPEHVNSFVFLARDHYYDGVTFHRVLPGFVAQTGDPTGTGSGGPGYTVPAEFTTTVKFERGSVGMARTNDFNSAGSQFFINYAATPSLDGQYTIFGQVTQGMDVVDCITPRDPSRNANAPAGDAIISIDIAEQ